MLTLNDGRNELWQWDTGRKLTVDADCSRVHFSNKVFGRSTDVDVVDGVAVIPDILLQTDKDLNVWAFVGTPENGYTKISKVFKVNKRSKPADYVFTPPEQTTLEEIKEKLDYLESIQDPDAIKNAVDEYLANKIDEKDPTVPDWAKQTTKPKYTATEVGAVAKVNGVKPDANGNVEITIPDSGGNVKNVTHYGAVGNGATDDTEAIAAAIAALNPGDTLYFPEGIYRVSNIDLKSNMTVQGDGWCSVIQLLDATTDYHGRNNCLNIENVENIIIRDIKLDGTRSTQQSTAPSQDGRLNGLHIRHASDIYVDNVWMYNNGYHGCIMTYATNVVFSHCKATDNGFRPIHGHTQIYNCRLSNCVCKNNGLGLTGGSGYENDSIFFFGAQHLVINDNIVKSNRRGCITVGCDQESTDVEDRIPTQNITISGNVCECYADLPYVPSGESDTGVAKFSSMGILVYGGDAVLENVSITGNTIKNAHEAIRFYAQENNVCNINAVVSGNAIIDCSYGVWAVEVEDVTISNNQFRNLACAWMYMQTCGNFLINGNSINAPGTSEYKMCRIHESNYIVIQNNSLIGDCANAIYVPDSNINVVVKNNTLFGFTDAEPIVNTKGHTEGNICIAAEASVEKVCIDPYTKSGFVRPTLVNPSTSSANYKYTTPVEITEADVKYELNTYYSLSNKYTDPSEFDYSPYNFGIVFLAGTELSAAVGIVHPSNSNGTVTFSESCIAGDTKSIWGIQLTITAEKVKELFPTATHVMMEVQKTYADPDDLANDYKTLNDGHAYVYREQ